MYDEITELLITKKPNGFLITLDCPNGKKNMKKKSTTSTRLSDCLKAVFEKNAGIRRKSWDKVNLVSMNNGTLTILLEDGENHPWTITEVDVVANDWEII